MISSVMSMAGSTNTNPTLDRVENQGVARVQPDLLDDLSNELRDATRQLVLPIAQLLLYILLEAIHREHAVLELPSELSRLYAVGVRRESLLPQGVDLVLLRRQFAHPLVAKLIEQRECLLTGQGTRP